MEQLINIIINTDTEHRWILLLLTREASRLIKLALKPMKCAQSCFILFIIAALLLTRININTSMDK